MSLIRIRSFVLEICARVVAVPMVVNIEFHRALVRSRGLPEITTDLLFAFSGLVEFLKGLHQLIGIPIRTASLIIGQPGKTREDMITRLPRRA